MRSAKIGPDLRLFDCFGTPIWPPWRHVKTSQTTTHSLSRKALNGQSVLSEVTILYFHFGVIEKSWRQLYQSFYNLSLPNGKPWNHISVVLMVSLDFLFKSKGRTYCYCFFPRRFFLSSIEAAVEHIRGGYVNDVLKGLSPAKVCIVFVWKIIWDRVANKKNG